MVIDPKFQASHQGTSASKKKKKAKLERVIRSMRRQQRRSSAKRNNDYYSPLNHLKDAQVQKFLYHHHKCTLGLDVVY